MNEGKPCKFMCNNCGNDLTEIFPRFDYLKLHCTTCDPEKHHVVLIRKRFKTIVTQSQEMEVDVTI